MFLSDSAIIQALENEEIKIADFNTKRLQQASYDIRLGNKFLIVKDSSSVYIDPVKGILPEYEERVVADGEEFILHPGSTVLGLSKENFGSKEYLIQLGGKSSLARLGLIVHNTAGIINPGHFLNITFELANLNKVPIVLRPGMEIAQLLFSKLTSSPSKGYDQTGRYNNENWKGYVEKNI